MAQDSGTHLGSGGEDASRDPRSHRMFVAAIRSRRLGEQPIIVRNISRHGIGARIRSGAPEVGEELVFVLDGELLEGQVRWVRKDRFGALLFQEVDPSRFNFAHKSWASASRPFEPGHVYDQFRPVSDTRRPGLKVR